MSKDRPPCVRCLLRELGETKAENTVREYIAALDPKFLLNEEDYRARLNICLSCRNLNRGTCLKTGAYVEAFAKNSQKHCPLGTKMW